MFKKKTSMGCFLLNPFGLGLNIPLKPTKKKRKSFFAWIFA